MFHWFYVDIVPQDLCWVATACPGLSTKYLDKTGNQWMLYKTDVNEFLRERAKKSQEPLLQNDLTFMRTRYINLELSKSWNFSTLNSSLCRRGKWNRGK